MIADERLLASLIKDLSDADLAGLLNDLDPESSPEIDDAEDDPYSPKTSRFEGRVMALLADRCVPIERQVRHGRWCFDGAITDTKILLEADGKYWHSGEKMQARDERKDRWCEKHGYVLIRVAEEDFKRDALAVVESIVQRWKESLRGIARHSNVEILL